MKSSMSLTEMATEIERQQKSKQDFVVRSEAIVPVVTEAGTASLVIGTRTMPMPINRHAHGQIASHYDIPRAYYDRMLGEAPVLWQQSVSAWASRKPNDKRMVRCLDGNVRGFLSPRYRRVDNWDVANAALPVMMETAGGGADLRIESAALTETRMYLKVFWPRIEAEIRKGDVVQAGVMLRNSEVGAGRVEVAPYLLRLVCLNGMKVMELGHKRAHVGRHIDIPDDDVAAELYSDDTKRKDDEALLAKIADTVRAMADDVQFTKVVARLRAATEQRIEINPETAVERLAVRHNLNETTRGSILRHLIDGGDLSAYGLTQAVTATANTVADYEDATDLEELGGRIISLDRDQWQELAQAA
jgi:hypothetical protein